jgi:hypothetical protein
MSLMPPADIVDALYETTTLRRVQMGAVVTRVVGTATGTHDGHGQNLTATTTAELSARSAHAELMNIIRGVRTSFLTGENIMHSAGQIGNELAENGARMIKQLYNSESTARLIDGDDLVWSCLPGGVATRLALRHMPLFTRAQQSRYDVQNGWNTSHCEQMRAFADAWVAESRSVMRAESKKPQVYPDRQLVSIDAVRSFERVNSLAKTNDPMPAFIVASSYAPLLLSQSFQRSKPNVWELVPGIQTTMTAEQPKASRFNDQNITRPVGIVKKASMHIAAWASRRLDSMPMRQWLPTSGVDKLVNTLADVDIGTVAKQTRSHQIVRNYYCPVGGRIETLPGHVPFAIESLGTRLVWLDDFSKELRRLIQTISPNSKSLQHSSSTIVADIVKPLGEGLGGFHGLERHPLTVSARDQRGVHVLLSDVVVNDPVQPDRKYGVDTLVATMKEITSGSVGREIETRIASMRSMAYNTDRFVNALGLVEAGNGLPQIDIILPNSESVISVALALALQSRTADQLDVRTEIYTHVDGTRQADTSRRVLGDALDACQKAQAMGCKAVTLAESCVALA